MNREDFIEGVRKQYADEVHEAYLECGSETGAVDVAKLFARLTKLMKSAGAEGLPAAQFADLVNSTLPIEVVSRLGFDGTKKAA